MTITTSAPMALSPKPSSDLQQLLDQTGKSDYPGVVIGLINTAGDELFLGSSEGTTVDSVFWIASCTKLIASIAALQLVEAGKLTLDGSLADIAPELSHRPKFVNSDPNDLTTEPAKRDITLRHLLTHTSGLRYAVFDLKTAHWLETAHPGGSQFAPLDMPLSSEPGEAWAYGMSMEWAGHIIERVSGMSLGAYVEKHILAPLGIKDATFQIETRDDLKARLAGLHAHSGEGFTEIPYPDPLMKPQYESGGGGMFASPRAYLAVLSAVLNGGVSPTTGARILKASTVDEMFVPQTLNVPNQGALGSGILPTAIPAFSRPIPLGSGKAWTLSHLTNLEEERGKSAGSAEWYGLANCYWTIDRQKGVAAIAFSNALPFGLPKFFELKDRLQEIIFAPGALFVKDAQSS